MNQKNYYFNVTFFRNLSLALTLCLLSFWSVTSLQAQTAYGITGGGDIVRFEVTTPGTLNVVGSSGAAEFPSGLDADGVGNWYLVDAQNTNWFYKINQAFGNTAELVGGSGLAAGFEPTDLAWDAFNNRLLVLTLDGSGALGSTPPRIYSVDVNTGAATPVGGGDGSVAGIPDGGAVSLAVDPTNGELYIQGIVTDKFYRVTPDLVTVTELNDLPWDTNFGQGAGFAPDGSKIYYAAVHSPGFFGATIELFEVNKTTGDPDVSLGLFNDQISDMFIHEPFVDDIVFGLLSVAPCTGEVTIFMGNIGQNDLSNFEVRYEITAGTGVGTVVTETVTATLAVNDVISYTFATPLPTTTGVYTITATLDPNNNLTDGNTTNNSGSGTFDLPTPVALNLQEDFEASGGIPLGWSNPTSGDGWTYGTAADLSSAFFNIPDQGSGNMMAMNDDINSANDAAIDRLITPPILINSVTAGNQLRIFADVFFVAFGGQGFIEVSTNGGASWDIVDTYTVSMTDWEEVNIDISSYIGVSDCIQIAFRYSDNGNWAGGIAVDNVNIREVWPQDAGVTAINRPLQSAYCLTDAEQVRVTIENYGFQDITNFPVTVDVNGTPITETYANTIPPFESRTYTFTGTADLSPATSAIDGFTALAGDGDTSNDSYSAVAGGTYNVTNTLAQLLPLVEDFEGGDPLAAAGSGWREIITDPAEGGWTFGDAGSLSITGFFEIPAGTGNIMASREDSDVDNRVDWLILPPFDFSTYEGVRMRYDAFFKNSGSESATLRVSTNGGVSWTIVDNIPDSGSEWDTRELNVSQFARESCVLFAFVYDDGNQFANGFAVDNINVLEIPDFDARVLGVSLSNCSQRFAAVTVTIENYGTQPISNFEVSYVFEGGATITEIVGETIMPFNTYEYTFTTTVDLTTATSPYTFDISVNLAGDADATNDAINGIDVTPVGGGGALLSENFESGTIPATWTQETNAADGGFLVDTANELSSFFWTIPSTNSSLIAATNDDACNCDKEEERLIMPEFNFSTYENIVLNFDAFSNEQWGGESFIEVSTDGGGSWTAQAIPAAGTWQTLSVNLSDDFGVNGETSVLVAFRYTDNNNWADGLAVDNITLTADFNATSNVTISSNPVVVADSVLQGTEDHLLYALQVELTDVANILKDVAFVTGGNYELTDFVPGTFKLWHNTVDDISTATLVTTKSTVASGDYLPFACLGFNAPAGTHYFYLTASIADDAIDGNNIFIERMLLNDVIFESSINTDGGLLVGGLQTFVRPNTAPIASNNTVFTNQDESYTFLAEDFEFRDIDENPVDQLLFVQITAITLPAGATLNYLGSPVVAGQVIPASDLANLIFTPAPGQSGENYASFRFKVSEGRDYSDFDYLMTIAVRPEQKLFMPTLFTPNGDNANDRFMVMAQNVATIEFKIFDRRGELIYETADVNEATQVGWDGTKEGEEQPSGAYIWTISGTTTSGASLDFNGKKTGVIKLVR